MITAKFSTARIGTSMLAAGPIVAGGAAFTAGAAVTGAGAGLRVYIVPGLPPVCLQTDGIDSFLVLGSAEDTANMASRIVLGLVFGPNNADCRAASVGEGLTSMKRSNFVLLKNESWVSIRRRSSASTQWQKIQPGIIAVQRGEPMPLRCIPTFFIPFTENLGRHGSEVRL
jgi:hypothetical protein